MLTNMPTCPVVCTTDELSESRNMDTHRQSHSPNVTGDKDLSSWQVVQRQMVVSNS
jgi:hypothetical protein